MSKLSVYRILSLLALSIITAYGQAFRVDPFPSATTATNVPPGAETPILAIPGASISLCTSAACSATAIAYTDATGTIACPGYAPVTWPGGTTACVSKSDAKGRFGFWVLPGQYFYRVTTPGGSVIGTYAFSVQAASAGGTITGVMAGTGLQGGGTSGTVSLNINPAFNAATATALAATPVQCINQVATGIQANGNANCSAIATVLGYTPQNSATANANNDALGAAATAQTNAQAYAANASNLTSGTVPVARLPVATNSTLGIVRPDNTTLTVSAGVLSATSTGGATTPNTNNAIFGNGAVNSTRAGVPGMDYLTGGDNSVAQSTSGKTTVSGLNNVLAFACGVPIGNGSAHTVGTPAGGNGCFAGVTTLAGLAAVSINGATPFSWITGQTSPFAYTASAYNLTNAKVVNIDISWLAIQTALLTGKTYIPTGTYIVGSVLPLPLYVPDQTRTTLAYNQISTDGQNNVVIKAGSDFGSGIPLLSCGDPTGTYGNGKGRYDNGGSIFFPGILQGLTLLSASGDGDTTNMDGFWWGDHLENYYVVVRGFRKGWSIVGDHSNFYNPQGDLNFYNFYWERPSYLFGDCDFYHLLSTQGRMANMAADPNGSIEGTFNGQTYIGSAPYAFFKVAGANSGGFPQVLLDSFFEHLFTEGIGNALIHDDNVFSGGVYTDANKIAGVTNVSIKEWRSNWSNSYELKVGGRYRRASFDVYDFNNFKIYQNIADGGDIGVTQGGTSNIPVGTFNANYYGEQNPAGFDLEGDVSTLLSNVFPLFAVTSSTNLNNFASNVKLVVPGSWEGTAVYVPSGIGNYTVASVGDCMERGAFWQSNPCGTSGSSVVHPVTGVVTQRVVLSSTYGGGIVPIAQSGQQNLQLNLGHHGIPGAEIYAKNTGIGAIKITAPGSGGTNGTFSWTATGGGCTTAPIGQFTVAGGQITSAAWSIPGIGCTSAPTIPTSASSGLTGATLTPAWPSGEGAATSVLADGWFASTTNGFGSPVNGTSAATIWLFPTGGGVPGSAAIGSAGITQLTGDVTAGPGTGSSAATLATTSVTPGSYTNGNFTVDAKGRLTAASNGSSGSGSIKTVYQYNAVGDGVQRTTGTCTSGSTTFTDSLGTWTSADTGKFMQAVGCAANSNTWHGTITYVSPTQVTLSVAAGATVSGTSKYAYGTPDTAAFQNCVDGVGAYGTCIVPLPSAATCPTNAKCGFMLPVTDQQTAHAPSAVKIRYPGVNLIGVGGQVPLFCSGWGALYTNSTSHPSVTALIRGDCINIGDQDGPLGMAGTVPRDTTVANLALDGMTTGNTHQGAFDPTTAPCSTTFDCWDTTHKGILSYGGTGVNNITISNVWAHYFKGEVFFSGGDMGKARISNYDVGDSNADGISWSADDFEVTDGTISNIWNGGMENGVFAATTHHLYSRNHLIDMWGEGIVLPGVDLTPNTGALIVDGNTFERIGSQSAHNTATTLAAIYTVGQIGTCSGGTANCAPPSNIIVKNNVCDDCFIFGYPITTNHIEFTNNTIRVMGNITFSGLYTPFWLPNPLSNVLIKDNVGGTTPAAITAGKAYVTTYMLNPGFGTFTWNNLNIENNSWDFSGQSTSAYTFTTSSGSGFAAVTSKYPTFRNERCTACTYANADNGQQDLTVSATIKPVGPQVNVFDSAAPITATLDASKSNDYAQVTVLNTGANAVTFANDSNIALGSPVVLTQNMRATFTYQSALSKWTLGPASNGGGGGSGIPSGTLAARPATCAVGYSYIATDQPPNQQLSICSSTNTYTTIEQLGGSGALAINGTTGALDIVSSVVPTKAGANTFTAIQTVPLLEQSVGTAVASASTIAPVAGIFHVTGTAAIATITPPSGMSSSVGGCLTIIADAAWTTTTAGNIFATMTAVAGVPYSACYEGSKWYLK